MMTIGKKIWGEIRDGVLKLSGERLRLSASFRGDKSKTGWFVPYWEERKLFHFEWAAWARHCHVGIEFHDDEMELGVAFPPMGLWIHFPIGYDAVEKIVGHQYKGREINISIHHWKLWLHLWARVDEWRAEDPWWMSQSYNLNPLVLLFGDIRRISTKVIDEQQVKVPLPEKEYDATVKIVKERWGRERFPYWPFASDTFLADWECKEGLPHPGKGTTGYNCEDTALMGGGFRGETNIPRVVGKIVGDVLYYRDRYPL